MARRIAALLALALPAVVTARGRGDASQEAAKVAAALAQLTRFRVDVAGTVPAAAGLLGNLGGGSTQRLEATFSADASEDAGQPRWRAILNVVLPMGGAHVRTVAVQQDGELYVSTTLPLPGGQPRTLAFRVPAPAASRAAPRGPTSVGQLTSWLEGQLEGVGGDRVRLRGDTLHLVVLDPSRGREEPLALSYDSNHLPTRVVIGDPGSPRADIRFTNFHTGGAVDTSLPLPREQYQSLSASVLGGLGGLLGGGAPAAGHTPARSPFVSQSSGTSPGRSSGMGSIPVPGLGRGETGEQATALQSIVSTLTEQLGNAMAPPPEGREASGIPGLNFSPGTKRLLQHMQRLREGTASTGGGSGGDPTQVLQALTGMMERLGSGSRPGASMNPQSLDKASQTIQQLLQRLRAGPGPAPAASGDAPAPATKTLKNPPRRGLSGGRGTSAEGLQRMQELMEKLKRTAPIQGK